MNPLVKIKENISKLLEFHAKLEEFASSEGAEHKTIEIGGAARIVSYCAEDILKAAREIATLASVKEQADYAAEQQAQKTEDFLAVLQKRKPNKVQKKKS